MDLWIRSQDKFTMKKADDIRLIDYSGLKDKLDKSMFSILADMEQIKSYTDKDGWGVKCNEICMGIYSTKGRALEVLDEIQETLKPIITNRKIDYIVYKMPQK